jgi:hypothetical protein
MQARIAGFAGDLEPTGIAGLEQWHHDLVRGPGIGGALENDELAVVHVRRNCLDCAGDVAEIRLVVLVERGGDADDDGVHLLDLRVVGGCVKADTLCLLNHFGQDADNVGATGVEGGYFVRGDVKACDAKPFARKKKREWETYIAHAHDADARLARFNALFELCERTGNNCSHILIVEPALRPAA